MHSENVKISSSATVKGIIISIKGTPLMPRYFLTIKSQTDSRIRSSQLKIKKRHVTLEKHSFISHRVHLLKHFLHIILRNGVIKLRMTLAYTTQIPNTLSSSSPQNALQILTNPETKTKEVSVTFHQ